MKKTFETGFEGITKSESVDVFMQRELAGNGHALSKQKERTGYWEGRAGSFKAYLTLSSDMHNKYVRSDSSARNKPMALSFFLLKSTRIFWGLGCNKRWAQSFSKHFDNW